MTNLDQKVQELRALAEKATPGEWQNGMDDLEGVVSIGSTDDGNVVCLPPAYCMELSFAKWPDNAAFIAASNPATLTAILDEYDRRGAALVEAKGALQAYAVDQDCSMCERPVSSGALARAALSQEVGK